VVVGDVSREPSFLSELRQIARSQKAIVKDQLIVLGLS